MFGGQLEASAFRPLRGEDSKAEKNTNQDRDETAKKRKSLDSD